MQALHALGELSGAEKAAEQFKSSGIDLLKSINAPPREVRKIFCVLTCGDINEIQFCELFYQRWNLFFLLLNCSLVVFTALAQRM